MARIDAVLFDLDHTLAVDHHLERDVLKAMAHERRRVQISDDDADAVLSRFRDGSTPLGLAVASSFASWGCGQCEPAAIAAEFKRRVLTLAPRRVSATPDAIETTRALTNDGVKVAIFSNGWTELQRLKAALIGYRGPLVVSEEIGAWKPQPRAFQIAVFSIGATLESSLYVGDDPRADIQGAKAVGMRAAWADFESRHYPPQVVAPDVVLRTLPQLLGFVASNRS